MVLAKIWINAFFQILCFSFFSKSDTWNLSRLMLSNTGTWFCVISDVVFTSINFEETKLLHILYASDFVIAATKYKIRKALCEMICKISNIGKCVCNDNESTFFENVFKINSKIWVNFLSLFYVDPWANSKTNTWTHFWPIFPFYIPWLYPLINS